MTTSSHDEELEAPDAPSAEAERPSSKRVRVRKRHVSRQRIRRTRIAVIVLSSILLVVSLCGMGVIALVTSGEESVRAVSNEAQLRVVEGAQTEDAGFTVTYQGETYRLRDNVVSVAVIGYDKGAGRTTTDGTQGQADGIVVLALDLDTGKATIIGVPRDSMLDVGQFAGDAFLGQAQMQACLAFSYGTDAASGARLTADVLSHLFYGMPVGYFFAMDMDGIGALATAVDGVPLTALSTIPDTAIMEGEPTVLYGSNALSYMRYRDMSDVEGSLARQERQTQFVQALASRALSLSNGTLSRLLDLYNTAAEHSVTNLDADEYAYLASRLLEKGISKADVINLEVGEVSRESGRAAYYLDQNALYETVLNVYYQKQEG